MNNMEFNFSGKRILVTGSGKGFGRATAIALAKAGCKVYALSRTQADLDSLVEEYPDITPITHDLKDWDKTRACLEQIEPLDGLVNNAASAPYMAPALEFSKEMLDFYIQNNLLSVINCTQVVAKKMIEAGKSGSIVNLASVSSDLALTKLLGYDITKAAVGMVTKQFALELGTHNIRVNSVKPTLVLTEMVQEAIKLTGFELDKLYIDRTPMGRLPSVPEIVSPILYLLSDASTMVTGTCHLVDGGMSCNITTKQ